MGSGASPVLWQVPRSDGLETGASKGHSYKVDPLPERSGRSGSRTSKALCRLKSSLLHPRLLAEQGLALLCLLTSQLESHWATQLPGAVASPLVRWG